ncbi:MAG TPA: S9 family peptidase, partial [Thermoanaerobaculia bacterium]|nr:S9 family peptidase [Thermoanaerobaculia bacterium]
AMKRIGAPHVSPNAQWIAYDMSTIDLQANTRRSAIYVMAAGGGEARQISDGTKQDESPAWSPDGTMLAYVSNRDGNPKQVYIYELASGETRKLTNLRGGAGSVKWVPQSRALVLVSDVYPDCGVEAECTRTTAAALEERPTQARVIDSLLFRHWNAWQEPTRAHIIYHPLEGAPRDLTPGPFDAPPFSLGGGDEFDISPDGLELVYTRNTDTNPELSTNSDLFIVPISGGEAKRITTRKGADTSPTYSPNGRYIAWRSQARPGFESDQWELWLYDRENETSRRVAPNFPNWITSIRWAIDSRSLFVTAPHEGNNVMFEILLDGRSTRLTGNGSVGHVEVSPDGTTLFFDWSSLKRPSDIYSVTRGASPFKLTSANDALLRGLDLGDTASVHWTGAEKAKIQGHLVRPPNFDPSKKYPAIVLIHGGPQGAWSDAWSYRWNPQMFASRGYVVLAPNPRGSTGFGQKFIEEITGDWAGKVYTDLMNGVDWLAGQSYVDAARIGAAGGSYGGYMVNWILGHSDRFKALVSHAGVFNLESMYGVTEELWFPEWELGGTPWDNPELYQKWSPHRFAKNFRTPTLVVHGELDFRVPIGEGFQLFTTLQRRGVPSKMVYFPDEGHWILKPQNSKLWHEQVLGWLDQWLQKAPNRS